MAANYWAERPDHVSIEDAWCGDCRQAFAESKVKMYRCGQVFSIAYVNILCKPCADRMLDREIGPVSVTPILAEHCH